MYEFTHPSGDVQLLDFESVLGDLKVFMRDRLHNIVIHSTRKGFMKAIMVENRLTHNVWTYRKIGAKW